MEKTKSPFLSLGFWGGIATLVMAAAPIVAPMIGMQPTELTTTFDHIGVGIGAVITLWGRVRATHILKF